MRKVSLRVDEGLPLGFQFLKGLLFSKINMSFQTQRHVKWSIFFKSKMTYFSLFRQSSQLGSHFFMLLGVRYRIEKSRDIINLYFIKTNLHINDQMTLVFS